MPGVSASANLATGFPRITFEAFGEQILDRQMSLRVDAGQNLGPAMQEVARFVMKVLKRRFDLQGAYGSPRWAALSQARIDEKKRLGLDPRILHATLALRNSLTRRGAKGQVLHTGRDLMQLETDLFYGRFHQRGEGQKVRKPVYIAEDNRRRFIKIIQRYLRTGEVASEPIA